MDTELLYFTDCYLREFEAKVLEVNNDKYIVLDKTGFYYNSGGQPFDTGVIAANGDEYPVVFAGKFSGTISHEVGKPGLKVGDYVKGRIDWDRRYRHMRMHTAAHIIDAVLYKEAGALCTGNQLGTDKSRIDFSLDVLDRDKMQQYIGMANEWVKKAIDVKIYFMPREDALKIPGVVKLASVMPPEVKELRIVEIPGIDLQADGGTQVKNTSEIGQIKFLSVENKGKANRRLYYTLD
ncbi:alanyl-tRNA editing protein [Candidatus Woesearchaeota archaeon]|nr:alanyl-tRNA editing protein [Candidatus Woesearchaeota archaeon]